jgi:hypothetical protein
MQWRLWSRCMLSASGLGLILSGVALSLALYTITAHYHFMRVQTGILEAVQTELQRQAVIDQETIRLLATITQQTAGFAIERETEHVSLVALVQRAIQTCRGEDAP